MMRPADAVRGVQRRIDGELANTSVLVQLELIGWRSIQSPGWLPAGPLTAFTRLSSVASFAKCRERHRSSVAVTVYSSAPPNSMTLGAVEARSRPAGRPRDGQRERRQRKCPRRQRFPPCGDGDVWSPRLASTVIDRVRLPSYVGASSWALRDLTGSPSMSASSGTVSSAKLFGGQRQSDSPTTLPRESSRCALTNDQFRSAPNLHRRIPLSSQSSSSSVTWRSQKRVLLASEVHREDRPR